jgi:integral membrane protein
VKLKPKDLYGIAAVSEMVTWTGLIAAMVLRYGFGNDVSWFFLAGISHGTVFLAHVTIAAIVGHNQRWAFWRLLLAWLSAVPPYMTVPFDRALHKRGLLDGDWRTEATDDPRDQRFPDPLFRWFIARPGVLLATILAIVSVLTMVALSLGPPREWGS